jgi:hypothetical protein
MISYFLFLVYDIGHPSSIMIIPEMAGRAPTPSTLFYSEEFLWFVELDPSGNRMVCQKSVAAQHSVEV